MGDGLIPSQTGVPERRAGVPATHIHMEPRCSSHKSLDAPRSVSRPVRPATRFTPAPCLSSTFPWMIDSARCGSRARVAADRRAMSELNELEERTKRSSKAPGERKLQALPSDWLEECDVSGDMTRKGGKDGYAALSLPPPADRCRRG